MGACMGGGGRWRLHVAPIAAPRRHDEDRERKASERARERPRARERERRERKGQAFWNVSSMGNFCRDPPALVDGS
jgi:hypothetical protein